MNKAMVIKKGTIKRIHVNQATLRANRKTGRKDPVFTVQLSNGPIKARKVEIDGPSDLVDRTEKPLKCGARIWIETKSQVVIWL